MLGLYELVKRFIAPYYSIYVIVLLIVIFAVAGHYVYNEYKPKESSILDKIHQPSENIDARDSALEKKEKPKLGITIPQIVFICLFIILFFLIFFIFNEPTVSNKTGWTFLTLLIFGLIVWGVRAAFYEKDEPEPWAKKYRKTPMGSKIVPGKKLTVYFFTADWCPHCRNAKPVIDIFENDYNNVSMNNHRISIERVDCTDSEEELVSKKINEFNVSSYPTVKIKDNKGNTFEFDAKITKENLVGFVESVANN